MISLEFLISSLVVILIPGTGVLFTVGTALAHGRRAGLHAALGCTLCIVRKERLMFHHTVRLGLLSAGMLFATSGVTDTALYAFRSLSVETASQTAWAALKDCRQRGYSVAVAVVDRGGNVQAVLRDKLAGPHTVDTAIRKAWTANSFRQSTADLAGMLQEGRIPSQVQHNPGALLVGGGLPVEAKGQIIGGIGVSGAPPGKSERDSIDGACAKAGLETIQADLEMAD